MKLRDEHIDYEKFCNQLIGMTVDKVEYCEIPYDILNDEIPSNVYYKTQFPNLDSVDYAIFFYTNNNKIIEIFWDGKFFQYGIGVRLTEQLNYTDSQIWDVTNNHLWKKLIGEQIVDIRLFWNSVLTTKSTGKTECTIYPQNITITFSNNESVFISVADFLRQGDCEVYGMMDNLLVTDDESLARKVKMIV